MDIKGLSMSGGSFHIGVYFDCYANNLVLFPLEDWSLTIPLHTQLHQHIYFIRKNYLHWKKKQQQPSQKKFCTFKTLFIFAM